MKQVPLHSFPSLEYEEAVSPKYEKRTRKRDANGDRKDFVSSKREACEKKATRDGRQKEK